MQGGTCETKNCLDPQNIAHFMLEFLILTHYLVGALHVHLQFRTLITKFSPI